MPIAPFTMTCTGVQESKAATDTVAAEYTVTLKPYGTENVTKPKATPTLLLTDEATAGEFIVGKEYTVAIEPVA